MVTREQCKTVAFFPKRVGVMTATVVCTHYRHLQVAYELEIKVRISTD